MMPSQIKWLDLTLPTPEANLACDEALLDWCEGASQDEVLRFWQPSQYFAVLGYSNRVEMEVDESFCRREHIPILRRASGGGAVLQGPGCFNYSLILRIEGSVGLSTIPGANREIMELNRELFESVMGEPVLVMGQTDLAIGSRKFSGNAQRRKKKCLLFHGCILLNLDLALMESVLKLPSRQPAYRMNRSHAEFVTNVDLPPAKLKSALLEGWEAQEELKAVPWQAIDRLVKEKYSNPKWNLR